MNTPTSSTNHIWPNWWRFAGVAGIIWAVLFVIGGFVLQGDTPTRSDSIESIRQYFTDDGDMHLAGDYIIGLAFFIFFLPYVIGLRWYIGAAEGWPPIWSWMSFAGGVIAVVTGGIVSIFWSALALGLKDNPQLDDATLRLMMDLTATGFVILNMAGALFVGSAGFVIFRSGVLWRWLGAIGLLAAILLLVGAAWPIDGDDEGVLGIIGIPGLLLTVLFVIISSVGMIMRKDPPMPPGAG